ncbi:MAG: glutamate 5-kinase, partial [Pirellulales bacterium]|nr:glutamate 5-kinase [Pirellulales bacterium]
MSSTARQELDSRSRTVVVKVGTRVLACEDGTLDQQRVTNIAEQLVQLLEEKRHVVLVSS